MSDHLLTTRIQPPAIGRGTTPRPRVRALLDAALAGPATVVRGGAGCGKTTALVDWLATTRGQTAWWTLAAEDNDPARFWAYFNAATPGIEMEQPFLIPGMGAHMAAANLDAWCNAAARAGELTWVFDDFHWLTDEQILRDVAYLCEHAPRTTHFVFSARRNPALPLARWRAQNRLAEVDAADLAFTREETAVFAAACLPELAGGAGFAERLTLWARGWPAGLRLMALALKKDPQSVEGWQAGKNLALDYLAQEALSGFAEEDARWLARLSTAQEAIDEPLAAALSGAPGGMAALERLAESGALLEREGAAYRFHPFFREMLQKQADQADRVRWNARLAAYYARRGDRAAALPYWMAAEQWDEAAMGALAEAEGRMRKGQALVLARWLERFPEATFNDHFELSVLRGWVLYLTGDVPAAVELAAALEARAANGEVSLPGWWAGLRCQLALVAERNHLALELAQTALAELPADSGFFRAQILVSLANAQQAVGLFDDALQSFKLAYRENQDQGNLLGAVFALANLGLELLQQGKRLQAVALCEDALERWSEGDHPLLSLVYLLRARLELEGNELDRCGATLDLAETGFHRLGIPGLTISWEYIKIGWLWATDQHGEARQRLSKARRLARAGAYVGYRQVFDHLSAQQALLAGQMARVENWLDEANLPDNPRDDPAREAEFITAARFALEAGSVNEAERRLLSIEAYARGLGRTRLLISTLLLRAQVDWKRGDLGVMKAHLEEALAISAPQGYTRALIEDGGVLLGVLARMPGAPAGIRQLFPAPEAPTANLVQMLTARELEVLRLMVGNRTNAEIAGELVLSVETVKVHLKHIFQKLECATRRQAVERARELGLIT